MWRLLVGILIGLSLNLPGVWALRMEQPQTITEWNTNTFSQLNQLLLQLWNISNGRYQLDVVTSDPDGSRKGETGEMVYYDTTDEYLCVNTSTSATDWDCAQLTD